MKTLSALFALFALLALATGVRAALPQPDLIAQIHFAGAQKISAATNATAFTNEFCSAEALALRTQTAGKLSVWLAGTLRTFYHPEVMRYYLRRSGVLWKNFKTFATALTDRIRQHAV